MSNRLAATIYQIQSITHGLCDDIFAKTGWTEFVLATGSCLRVSERIYLILIYPKNVKDDLNESEKAILKTLSQLWE